MGFVSVCFYYGYYCQNPNNNRVSHTERLVVGAQKVKKKPKCITWCKAILAFCCTYKPFLVEIKLNMF